MLKVIGVVSSAIAITAVLTIVPAQAQRQIDPAGFAASWPTHPNGCQTDEGYGRKGSCDAPSN